MSEFEILVGENYIPFIKDISVKDVGQTVIIKCTNDPDKELNYRVICHLCESLEISFNKECSDRIDDKGYISVVEFSIKENPDNKKSVYVYALVVELRLVCESIKLEED